MNILIIDRDDLNNARIKEKIGRASYHIDVEEIKNDAVDRVAHKDYGVILLDPAPLTNARPLILSMRRASRSYPYIILMGQDAQEAEEYIRVGANAFLPKPFDSENLLAHINDAARLTHIIQILNDDSIDFPSAGGIIAKSAFNQLFLSAIDRADRYGENTFVVFITVANYNDMLELDGPYHADYAVAKISQKLAQIRRQSDIIGQTAKHEYALLLQRPQYDTEPVDAANRFAEEMSKLESIRQSVESDPEIRIQLIALPSGHREIDHRIQLGGAVHGS